MDKYEKALEYLREFGFEHCYTEDSRLYMEVWNNALQESFTVWLHPEVVDQLANCYDLSDEMN